MMNILEEIQNCPVEWKELGEVAQIINGFAFKSSRYSESGIRVIRISDVQKGKLSNKDIRFYPLETKNEIKQWLLNENDLVVSLTGNVGRVAMIPKKALPAALNQRVACIRTSEDVLIRYLFHYLDQFSFEQEAIQNSSGGGQKNLSSAWLAKYKIPIPPLKIQEKIVQTLDKMTEYATELTSELTSRKKQYSFYRDKLLSFEDEVYPVEWKTLLDVSKKITSGGTPDRSNSLYYGGSIPWLRTQEVDFREIYDTELSITDEGLANSSAKWIEKNSVIVAMYGATAAKVGIAKIPLTTNQACCNIEVDEDIANYRYVYHWLTYNYEILKSMGQGSQSNINAGMIKTFKIPVPSLEIQSRIVQVLDNFDTVCNDLNIGLPKEIELRQKQYEYWREQLLNFNK